MNVVFRQLRSTRSTMVQQGGASAVEFAIVGSLLFLFVFAIIGFGLAIGQNLTLAEGAQAGARVGIVGGGCDDIRTAATAPSAALGIDTGDIDVAVSASSADGAADVCGAAAPSFVPCAGQDQLVVTTSTTTSILNVIPLLGVSSTRLTGQGTLQCEVT